MARVDNVSANGQMLQNNFAFLKHPLPEGANNILLVMLLLAWTLWRKQCPKRTPR